MAMRSRIKGRESRLSDLGGEREELCPAMYNISRSLVATTPSLRLVEPCDTDPETYARIRHFVLYADRDVEGAEAAIRPFRPPPLTYPPGATSTERRRLLHDAVFGPEAAARRREQSRREDLAVKAAERRLASLGRP